MHKPEMRGMLLLILASSSHVSFHLVFLVYLLDGMHAVKEESSPTRPDISALPPIPVAVFA